MGFAVLHIQKPKGNDARTTAHIERTVQPSNADPDRQHLNKEFISFPEGVGNRTQAIQHRIDNAGITRKIRENQVRALQVMLSGTYENMLHIQASGKLDEWCKDNIEWLQETFGKDNLVSAVLHMDEKTPHIHATVVPIVTGERRKSKAEEQKEGKKYKKKPKDLVRLCADDIMTRDNLTLFQDSYAERMEKHGLDRGIKGSDARHISTPQFYRELHAQNQELKEEIAYKEEQIDEVNHSIRDLYDRKDEAREKFLNMDMYVKQKEKDIPKIEAHIEKLRQEYEPLKTQEELNTIHRYFPLMKERLRIAELCERIGLAFESIKALLHGKTLTSTAIKLFSPEHNRYFEAKDVRFKVEKEAENPNKLKLSINGENILDWFKKKFEEVKLAVDNRFQPKYDIERGQSRGVKM
ncbi:plasmid recombination protein [Parabacteroides sp. OttesenSCG-928-J18]|nr:plasmid recombination protein [Parabacteroides sp. OttesenSCG-928-J18]